ncbi:glycosyltransferase family 4 protein [Geminicoccaceae bacterium SYSU G07066]|uniref:Glycosyltransferase family 4 protein n=2 Tax=Benzoatithermus flavus TaxID=3108223 RepID=A0ABU8XS87_9PROT
MLTVLGVAYPLAPVSRDAVGGAEQVLAQLDAALVRRGHRSIVVACGGSRVEGVLVATPRRDGILDDAARTAAHAAHREAIAAALARWPVDLVHLHGIDFHAYLPPPGVPALVTLHLPLAWYPPEALHPQRPDTWLHAVSAAQRQGAPGDLVLLPDIPNGVAIDELAARHARRGFALALGRICPEKGFHIALAAAKTAGVGLLLGGQVYRYEAHERYFRDEIAPRLDRWRRFLGPLDFARKRRLLTAARCLLVPSLVAETGSLVAMEALACGTPVIAFPNGALTEVIEHGVTGFLVRDGQEMAEAIGAAGRIDPEACRRAARERFSAERTVARYLAVYEDLVRRRSHAA